MFMLFKGESEEGRSFTHTSHLPVKQVKNNTMFCRQAGYNDMKANSYFLIYNF